MATGQDIVDAARLLLGTPYRLWYSGASVPMWYDDGYTTATPQRLKKHVQSVGVMCSDLVNFACAYNGLEPGGGTQWWNDNIVDWVEFDPAAPGVPGAIAVNDYTDPENQGHIGIYTGEHTFIQAIMNPGVTEDFTDYETFSWGGWCSFKWYGYIPGVDYAEYTDVVVAPLEKQTWVPVQAWYNHDTENVTFWDGGVQVG